VTVTDSTAPTVELMQRAADARARLEAARAYLRAKADGSYVPPHAIAGEAQGGYRGSETIRAYLPQYLALIDRAEQRSLREACEAAGCAPGALSAQQEAEALELAMDRLKITGARLLDRHGLCDYGIKEFCVSIGVPVLEAVHQAKFKIVVQVAHLQALTYGSGVDTRAARAQIEVARKRLEASLKRSLKGGDVTLIAISEPIYTEADRILPEEI